MATRPHDESAHRSSGGCFCGFVRYEITEAPAHETSCHCTICRRVSAAPFVAWLTVPEAAFRLTAGTPTRFASSDHGHRTFCPRCGTPLTFAAAATPDEIDVTTCSLDDPERVPPRHHTHTASQLGWIHLADGLPTFRDGAS